MNRWYDHRMYRGISNKYYENSGYFNFGYWEEKILDVACGIGATTVYLLRYYPPSKVTGINISEKQLETARKMAPGCTFLRMDAAQLEFEDNYFDNIICLEAVFHFRTRKKFLSEAHRVLKPGGRLVLTDILLTDWGKRNGVWSIPKSNNEPNDLHQYEGLYRNQDFKDIKIVDASKECWEGYYKKLASHTQDQLLDGEIDIKTYEGIASRIFRMIPYIRHYLIVATRKDRL
jgi:ubiquinone/menaquinone biosynthesis C-methylase UbiE